MRISDWSSDVCSSDLPASILSITFVNWLVTQIVPPRVLPKLEFKKGIPKDCATAVAMPVLVANASDIPSLLQRLEAHRLANPDTALQFVLLSDFADADAEDMPTDDDITHALV